LYKFYNITVDWSHADGRFKWRSEATTDREATAMDDMDIDIVPDSEIVHARQHTMLWNEEHCLDGVNTHPQLVTANYTHAFGALHVILSGDFKQLPPSPKYKGNRSLVQGPILWQSLTYFPLVQVMCQSNVQFSTILTKIGSGQRLTAEEQKLI
jgi:hypothetical protein